MAYFVFYKVCANEYSTNRRHRQRHLESFGRCDEIKKTPHHL